ncbi:MAG: DNA-binding domain-containing protein [Steroidobacteraceae bacterium]
MPSLAERQKAFAAALIDPSLPLPGGLMDPEGRACPRRFAVYRNNVATALIEALETSFPAMRRLVGEAFFREAALRFALGEPPASPVLLEYGAGFPAFLERFEPAASLPYLPDVARIERAWIEAHHAADAAPLDPAALAGVSHDRAGEIRFSMHPSLRVVRSRYPALTIWRMNVADGVPGPVALDAGGEDALVVRPEAEVCVRFIPAGGADLLEALVHGEPLAAAAEAAMKGRADFDLAGHLSGLLDSGAFTGFSL